MPLFVIPNEVRNLGGIDIERFLPVVEMTVAALSIHACLFKSMPDSSSIFV